ncbi:hypothetical protein HSBAA_31270 [Vreelandella sulfidaeris]|uniref:Uncharacterized protein n=1 Tax=Vreelandella sulfidaeris TaxID=115553 RepID=A0A455UB78_9GAMM|nr:hypothetical protein HSBAA_31270 [Halomonas sulfidaeris]
MLLALTAVCGFWSVSAIAADDWADITEPLPGEPRIIGHHGGACLVGPSNFLPKETATKRWIWAAIATTVIPTLIDYIQRLGQRVDASGFGPMLVVIWPSHVVAQCRMGM